MDDNIKMDWKKVMCEDDKLHLAQDKDHWLSLLNSDSQRRQMFRQAARITVYRQELFAS